MKTHTHYLGNRITRDGDGETRELSRFYLLEGIENERHYCFHVTMEPERITLTHREYDDSEQEATYTEDMTFILDQGYGTTVLLGSHADKLLNLGITVYHQS